MGLLLFFRGDWLKDEKKMLKIRGHRGEGITIFLNSLKVNLFSVSSVVGF